MESKRVHVPERWRNSVKGRYCFREFVPAGTGTRAVDVIPLGECSGFSLLGQNGLGQSDENHDNPGPRPDMHLLWNGA